MSKPTGRRPLAFLSALLFVGALIAGAYTRLRRRRRPTPDLYGPGPQQPAVIVQPVAGRAPSAREQEEARVAAPSSVPPIPIAATRPRLSSVEWLAFAIVLLVGFYFRFAGLNWDQSQHLHPDERFLTFVTTAVEIPDSLGEYFDSQTSPLNPYNKNYTFFVYGNFPISSTRFVAEALSGLCVPAPDAPVDATTGRPAPTVLDSVLRAVGLDRVCSREDGVARPLTGYEEVTQLGRVLSALLDLATLVWLFLAARELYGARTGLAAMALGALAVLHLQQAHFFTADTFATHFVAAAFYFIVRFARTGGWPSLAAAGFACGLATASRINVLPIFGMLGLAVLARAVHDWRDRDSGARMETALLQIIAGLVVLVVTFRVFMPYAFDGFLSFDERWTANMGAVQRQTSGEDPGGPPGVQWTSRAPIVFPWVNMVFWGLGLPLGLAAWIGWGFAAWQLLGRPYLSRESRTIGDWLRGVFASQHLLIWVWVTAYFVWQGSQWVKSIRYLLPIYPALAILAGWLIVSAWDWARRSTHKPQWLRGLGYALPILVLVGTLLWAVAFTEIYRQPVTRVAASEWIYENVPSAATLHVAGASGLRDVHLQLPSTTNFPGPGSPQVAGFTLPADGTLTGIAFRELSGPDGGPAPAGGLRVTIALDPAGSQVVAQAQFEIPAGAAPGAYSLPLSETPLKAGQQYFFVGEATGGPLVAQSNTLGNEHWDDPIPLRIGGRDGYSFYRGYEIPNYNEDTPDKLGQMLDWLQQSDYIFLTSNRLYGSIPRQPLRYPLATEYYRLLFTGQLGFDLVAEFTSYPRLGPFEFPDQETTQALGLWPDPTRLARPGVISVPYPPAEEAFSVYDHPRVVIFKKRANFSAEDVIQKLSRFDLESAYHGFTPRNEAGSPTGQMLAPEVWEAQETSGTWSALFDRDGLLNANPGAGVLVWYLLVGVLGLAAFPILFVALPGLADRGYGLARTLGLLLLSFLVWFPASYRLLPFTREAIALMAIVLAAIGGLITWKKKSEIRDWLRRNARLIAVEEVVFTAAFVLFLLLRYGNPDLWHPWKGGEKPMDFAYFNAVIKSQYFPPYDPWFSGGFMTYYYYGWVMLAAPVKMLGIVPAIAYNIVVPTVYALAALGTFSVAHGLVSRFGRGRHAMATTRVAPTLLAGRSNLPVVVGVIAAIFVMLIGNLGEIALLYSEIGKVGQSDFNQNLPLWQTFSGFADGLVKVLTGQQSLAFPTDWWYWVPTRIIPAAEGEAGPITEFPFFTFLYADLHAHMMALPITILVLGLAVSWVVRVPLPHGSGKSTDSLATETVRSLAVGQRSQRSFSVSSVSPWLKFHWTGLLSLVLGGLSIGALRAANTADYPTYLGVALVALAFGTWAAESLRAKETWLKFVVRAALLFGSALVLFAPFGPSDRLGGTAPEGWEGSKTSFWSYLAVHGIFLFPIVTLLLLEVRRWGWRWLRAAWNVLGEWRWFIVVLGAVALLGLLYAMLVLEVSIALIAGPLMLLSFALMLRPRLSAARRFWLLMVFLALALSFAVEVVVFRGDISRMNMVFKFYYQIWVLLGIAAAVALGWLWRRSPLGRSPVNGAWRTTMIVLVVAGMLYPPLAAFNGKLKERFNAGDPPGLDGMAYMRDGVYYEVNDAGENNELRLRWDYEALMWMQDNVAGTPVVAEGRSRHEYLWGSRVSIYTGLPTLIGWGHHQRQQRGVAVPHSVIDRRILDVAALFGDPSLVTARKILDRYGVKYVYVGELEKAYYPAESLAKFDQMTQEGALRVAYQNPGVTIYEVSAPE
jgi:YYY domain-containing protein